MSISRLFANARLDFPCQKCGYVMKETIARLQRDPDLTCPSCHTVNHVDASEFRSGMKEADRSLADFQRQLNRTFKVNFRL